MTYAQNTSVSADKSRGEIERILQRYGADQFIYGWDRQQAMIQFRAEDRIVRFVLPMPDPNDRQFTHTPNRGNARSESAAHQAWEQATRQRWRALALVVKAKLEAVEAGISEFQSEFLANIVLPSGETVGDWIAPQIEYSYDHYDMPPMLPTGGPSDE